MFGLDDAITALSPDQLIAAALAAPVDLLWNGGIGTYVKASNQSHADVGDRSNDAVRIDASQLRARVVGEGGNLGLTQEARIEYSLAGGLVNTDFIDNSAGVDTSDHEVNIKILLDGVVRDGEMTTAERDTLLQTMTDEVARLVLADNYHQNRALAAARAQSAQMLHVHARYIRKLEREGRIRRRLDVLPADKDIAERRSTGSGLTLPEFSVLLAHTKIALGQEVLASDVPDDPYLQAGAEQVLPDPAARAVHRPDAVAPAAPGDHHHRGDQRDGGQVRHHVRVPAERGDRRLGAAHHRGVAGRPRGLRHARVLAPVARRWTAQVDTSAQVLALLEARKLTERATRWLLHFRRPPFDIQATIDFFADGVLAVAGGLPKLLAGLDLSSFEERRDVFASRGFPDDLADRIAGDGARLLGFRHRRYRVQHWPPGRGDRRGLLRSGRPAADHQAARPDHRAARGMTGGTRWPGTRCATTCTRHTRLSPETC